MSKHGARYIVGVRAGSFYTRFCMLGDDDLACCVILSGTIDY